MAGLFYFWLHDKQNVLGAPSEGGFIQDRGFSALKTNS
jgi:hypothetical protein